MEEPQTDMDEDEPELDNGPATSSEVRALSPERQPAVRRRLKNISPTEDANMGNSQSPSSSERPPKVARGELLNELDEAMNELNAIVNKNNDFIFFTEQY